MLWRSLSLGRGIQGLEKTHDQFNMNSFAASHPVINFAKVKEEQV